MKDIKLKNGEIITILRANKSDGEEILNYINSVSCESDFLTFGEGEFNITVEDEELFIENTLKQDNALFIIAKHKNKIIGNLNFAGGVRSRTKHIGEFGVTVLKEYWNMGIGYELIKYLISWAKESRVIRKINLRVRSDNSIAINLYKKLDFIEEGIIRRDFLIDGVFYDSLLMGLIID